MENQIQIIVLAAGFGKRMKSSIPKVCHKIAGETILNRVLNTITKIKHSKIYIVGGHKIEYVKSTCFHSNITWVHQLELLGTAHAVSMVMPLLDPFQKTLVVLGDVPLINLAMLESFIKKSNLYDLGIINGITQSPKGLGRVCRNNDGKVYEIIEEKDASYEQLQIKEFFSGICIFETKDFISWWPKFSNNNSQNEFYLTEIIARAHKAGKNILTFESPNLLCIKGINNKNELAVIERAYQLQQAQALMESGAIISDPNRIDIRGTFKVGIDSYIDINSVFEGNVILGENVHIGPNVFVKDSYIGDNVIIKSNTHIENSNIGNDCKIGPFARIRPGTSLSGNVTIGNFVEIKNSNINENSKINHLSYVGDAKIGNDVNIGAGTITCNYDGVNKHTTVIKDNAFIGSNSQIIAPVIIGENSTVAAGSTVTHNAPKDSLLIARSKQKIISNWQRKNKKIKR